MKYSRKPKIIEAMQWTGDNLGAVNKWLCQNGSKYTARRGKEVESLLYVGVHCLYQWQWLSFDENGNFKVYHQDRFAETFEEVKQP